jgi:hypothetical protein
MFFHLGGGRYRSLKKSRPREQEGGKRPAEDRNDLVILPKLVQSYANSNQITVFSHY